MGSRIEEPMSWGDLMRHEERRRKEMPWKADQLDPVRFVTRYEVSRKETEFNPILQKYTDNVRELDLQRTESETLVKRLNRSKIQQLRNESLQDAITHASKVPGSKSNSSFFRESKPTPEPGYNIISNIDLSEHHYDSPENRPAPMKETKHRFKVLIKPREFNIITNRYEQEHEKKVEIDKDRSKKLATLKYWQTHDFNPVTCSFYRKQKERRFVEKLQKREALHGADHLQRLPASLRFSEGNFCNIVSKEVKDPEMLKRWDKKHMTKKAGRGVDEVERTQRQRAVQLQQLHAVRKKNRSLRKYSIEERLSDRDHDILNNKSYVGRKGVTKWRAEKTGVPSTLWGSIEADWNAASRNDDVAKDNARQASSNQSE